jgi:drug/metabolite transporter (DMT)-like permease
MTSLSTCNNHKEAARENPSRAVFLFGVMQTCSALEQVAVHALGATGWQVMQIVVLRNSFGLLLVVALARGVPWRANAPYWQAARCIGSVGALVVSVTVVRALPLADATALSFLQPLFLVIFGALLGETVTRRQLLAVALGFGAAMLIIKPSFAGVNWLYLLAILGAAINAAVLAISRPIGRHDPAPTMLLYASSAGLLVGLAGAAQQPVPPLSAWLLGIALGPVALVLGIASVTYAGVSAVAAAGGYLRLPAALLFGALLFGEFPSAMSLAGAIVIVGSSLLAGRTKSP